MGMVYLGDKRKVKDEQSFSNVDGNKSKYTEICMVHLFLDQPNSMK